MPAATAKPDCYVARCPECERIVVIYVMDCTDKKAQARELAKWIRDGLVIGATTSEEFRSSKEFGHTDECAFEKTRKKSKA